MIQQQKQTRRITATHTITFENHRQVEFSEERFCQFHEVKKGLFLFAYDTEICGESATITGKVVNSTEFSLIQIGKTHSRRIFQTGGWTPGEHYYAGQKLQTVIYTKEINYFFTKLGGMLEVLYEVWQADTHLGYYKSEFFID